MVLNTGFHAQFSTHSHVTICAKSNNNEETA
jgi:hypothetical protein